MRMICGAILVLAASVLFVGGLIAEEIARNATPPRNTPSWIAYLAALIFGLLGLNDIVTGRPTEQAPPK